MLFPKKDSIKETQLTPQNRMVEVTKNETLYRFYSKGAWEGPVFMMVPWDWTGEDRSRGEIEALMMSMIEAGSARPSPDANAI